MFNKIKNGLRFICDSKYRFIYLADLGFYDHMDDAEYLKKKFYALLGYELDLENPKTFNEKMQWLKLYDRKPEYVKMVDKYEVKKYVSDIIGEEYIIPTISCWNTAGEIDWNKLPNKFVLKVTHDSGGIVICKDKDRLNKNQSVKNLKKSLKRNYYLRHREWPYKEVCRRIIAEKYIAEDNKDLVDYKFMCFNGECKCIFTGSDRYSEDGLKVTFYDRDWNILPFERHYKARKIPEKKPEKLKEMILLAEKLSKDIPFVRVDFYLVKNHIYFGEITFFPGSGFEEFTPFEWDEKLGKWLQLPKKKTL